MEKQNVIFERSAGIVIFRQLKEGREYLILHYPGGHYDLPKGHVEGDETDHQAAYRELIEETGIKEIIWIEGFSHQIDYFYMRGSQKMHKDVMFFLARTTQKKVTISFEHKGYLWLPFDQAYQKTTFITAKTVLQKAEQFLKKSEKRD